MTSATKARLSKTVETPVVPTHVTGLAWTEIEMAILGWLVEQNTDADVAFIRSTDITTTQELPCMPESP